MVNKNLRQQQPTRPARRQITAEQALAMALEQMRAGRLGDADAICRKIIAAEPNNPEAFHLRGVIAQQAGQSDLAIRLIERASTLKPDDPMVYNDLGMIHHSKGRHAEALGYLEKAIELSPDLPAAHVNIGNALHALGRYSASVDHFRHALKFKPDLAGAHNNLAWALTALGLSEEALESAAETIRLAPQSPQGYSAKAGALGRLGRFEEALEAHKAAIDLQPNDTTARMHLVRLLGTHGRTEEAVAEARRVLNISPGFAPAYGRIAHLTKFTARNHDVTRMEQLEADPGQSDMDRAVLNFALGKIYDDLGEHTRAFDRYVRANALIHKGLAHDPGQVDRVAADLMAAFGPDRLTRFAGSGIDDETPVFIIGMPRSGTSLVEQILSSHEEVTGAGELSAMETVGRQFRSDLGARTFTEAVERASAGTFADLGQAYLRVLRGYSPDARLITDKMPANFLYVGLISLMLPKAKIIHCRRSPIETCLSIFKYQFTRGSISFGYDLDDLAHYYRVYQDMMDYWHEVLPGRILDVDYEEVVADQEAQTRRMLDYCGLEWSDACLRFYETSRPVHTVSQSQVRQPIYKKSLRASERYGEALKPLRDALERAGVRLSQDG